MFFLVFFVVVVVDWLFELLDGDGSVFGVEDVKLLLWVFYDEGFFGFVVDEVEFWLSECEVLKLVLFW